MEYTWTHTYSLYLYVHICTHVYIHTCAKYMYVHICMYMYTIHKTHIYSRYMFILFYFIFSNREENETSCGNKLVQNMLELSVFTCTKRLLLIRRRAVWTLGHMHLESWNVLLLGRIVHWLVDKAISCLLEASVISVPPFTLSLKKD